MDQKHAIGYARSAVENDERIKQQVEDIQAYCRTHKLLMREVYVDNGNLSRPAQKRLLTEIRNGKHDVLVIASLDRLSRQMMEVRRILRAVRRAGCEVAVVHLKSEPEFLQLYFL